MTCLEAQSNILSFVEKNLPEDKKIEFVKHIRHCNDCKEELEIYYTLIVGMRKLDNNEDMSLDFRNRLDDELNRIETRAKKAKRFRVSSFGMVFTALVCIMFVFYGRCLTKVYDVEQFLIKEKQGSTYFYDAFGDDLYSYRNDIIAENEKKNIIVPISFYDKVHIYNVVASFDISEFADGGL